MTRRFSDLSEDLYERSPESRDRVARKVGELERELGLAALRARRERTQTEIATALGTSQPGVSRMERQDDLLVSTLSQYVHATGGKLRLIAAYADYDIELTLRETDDTRDGKAFRVIWQNLRTRQFVHVGQLTHDGREFSFSYTADARLHEDFRPFSACPDYGETYRWTDLPSFLQERLPLSTPPKAEDAMALGLSPDAATPIELLEQGAGTSSHDVLQIVPEPEVGPDGMMRVRFLASGVRHADEDDAARVSDIVASLSPGQHLQLRDDVGNTTNVRAIQLTVDEQPVGWVPDYLVDEIHKMRDGSQVTVTVLRANGETAPWHLRLLCELRTVPSSQGPLHPL